MKPATSAPDLRARKRYGQHFLEPAWADKLVAAIAPHRDDRFLEIGPGPGALTRRLAPLVSSVTAVEVDLRMVTALAAQAPPNVTLLHQDFLELELATLSGQAPLRAAGNLPYNVSSPILFKLLRGNRELGLFSDATLMLQREVADRIRAAPGTRDYGVLAILIGLHADVRALLALPPGAFRPVPKVHSTVVRLTFRHPRVQLTDEAAFERMVRSMFTQRRKMLANALAGYAGERGVDAASILDRSGIAPARRPETLQLEELARLAEQFAAS